MHGPSSPLALWPLLWQQKKSSATLRPTPRLPFPSGFFFLPIPPFHDRVPAAFWTSGCPRPFLPRLASFSLPHWCPLGSISLPPFVPFHIQFPLAPAGCSLSLNLPGNSAPLAPNCTTNPQRKSKRNLHALLPLHDPCVQLVDGFVKVFPFFLGGSMSSGGALLARVHC
ncbi:hypothetical protein SETIT_4G231600v2 [Setaria italica]|uniref:Uncharacterized protein n=1 Tax=Setaria italica TaxID=4555 RepID=A0A368QX99_SETIT|nr:hypothetical protein SETIT_4G231600v2 [Setaria italica]